MQGPLLALLCGALFTGTAPATTSPDTAQLPGEWRAVGRYYETRLQQGAIPPQFELRIDSDLRLSGTIGEARLRPTPPRSVGARIDYYVELEGRVEEHPDLRRKDRVLILITATGPGSFEADFHLKSWFGFDPTMHPGSLSARQLVAE